MSKGRHLCIVFYDLIHLNNETLLRAPLQLRREYLKKAIQPFGNFAFYSSIERFQMPKSISVACLVPLRKHFLTCIQSAGEGLVIKGCNSLYTPGKRTWIKVRYIIDNR